MKKVIFSIILSIVVVAIIINTTDFGAKFTEFLQNILTLVEIYGGKFLEKVLEFFDSVVALSK